MTTFYIFFPVPRKDITKKGMQFHGTLNIRNLKNALKIQKRNFPFLNIPSFLSIPHEEHPAIFLNSYVQGQSNLLISYSLSLPPSSLLPPFQFTSTHTKRLLSPSRIIYLKPYAIVFHLFTGSSQD